MSGPKAKENSDSKGRRISSAVDSGNPNSCQIARDINSPFLQNDTSQDSLPTVNKFRRGTPMKCNSKSQIKGQAAVLAKAKKH